MSNFSPPPTYAEVVLFDKEGKHPRFNPIWLKWFVDLTANLTAAGTPSSGIVTVEDVILTTQMFAPPPISAFSQASLIDESQSILASQIFGS